MKVTRFFKLKRAIENLNVNFVANEIALLEERLIQRGQPLDPENTAITYEGIYYIHPQSGMAVRVALYNNTHPTLLSKLPSTDIGFSDSNSISSLNEYHLMRCNALNSAEKAGWPKPYYIVQRLDGLFNYRFQQRTSSKNLEYKDVLNQKLNICQSCFVKANSLLEGVQHLSREEFEVRNFFDVEFFGAWGRYGENYDASESLANMYPKDWQDISRIRKEQVQNICEGCNTDFSGNAQRFLHVHPIDYVKKKLSYVKLQCLCISCLAEYPERSHFKKYNDYQRCLYFITHGVEEPPKAQASEQPKNDQKKKRWRDDDSVVRRRFE